jgi:protein ImuA
MNIKMSESADRLSGPRRKIAALEKRGSAAARKNLFATGHIAIDERLGGGLASGRLHEVYATDADDVVSAAGYALMLTQRVSPCAPVIWIRHEAAARRDGMIFGSGLIELGIDPGRFLFVLTTDVTALLRAVDEILRCHQVGAVLVEVWDAAPALNLTASRRLALAAEKSGVTAFLLRADTTPSPSAAQSRWEVKSLPSTPLQANAPGHPAIEVKLVRHRAGFGEQSWRVEWDRDRLCFHEPPLPGAVVSLSSGRPVAVAARASWRLSA